MIYRLATPDQYEIRRPLINLLPKYSRGAEIGVWSGDFSEILIQELNPKEISLIDPWTFRTEPAFEGSGYAGSLAKSQADMDELYLHVTKRFTTDKRVKIHRLESADAANLFPSGSLDWVYIDGDHRYISAINDIRIWKEKITPDGLVTGDDYGAQGWWEGGVTKAVDEIVANGEMELVLQENYQYALRKLH